MDTQHQYNASNSNTVVTSTNRSWNILNWNIRGLNADDKQRAVRSKIDESSCAIYCLQEIKIQHIDHSKIRKWAPKRFNQFAYHPAEGQSGGIIVGWAGNMFSGQVIHNLKYAITVKLTSLHTAEVFHLTTVYSPCQREQREEFINWLASVEIEEEENWIIMGDFNFYRSLDNRNRAGGNFNDVMTFNQTIEALGLMEIPLKGRQYTWSNM